ncbi:MAG: hypothetical protein ACR2M6_02170 [Vampirovibrionia bacterium]
MSDVFANINNQMATVGDSARSAANIKALEAKQKVFEKKKTIEEGLSGFKAITGLKKIAGAANKNLSPYIKQEAKASWNQFKDQWSKKLSDSAERYKPSTSPSVQPSTAAPEADALGDQGAAAAATDSEVAGAIQMTPIPAIASEPEADAVKLLPGEEGEAAATKVGQTLNPFNLGGEGVNPAASGASSLTPIAEATGAEERAAQLSAVRVQLRSGLDTLRTQQAAINDGISKLGNSGNVATPGSASANEASAAAKAAEAQAGKAAEKQAAEKAAGTGGEDTAEVTGEEAVGGFLDDTGILAPLGLLIGAIGLGTAAEEAKKKMPKMNPAMSLGDQVGGVSYQSGIN